jgi:hypothetical protein
LAGDDELDSGGGEANEVVAARNRSAGVLGYRGEIECDSGGMVACSRWGLGAERDG